MLPFDVRPNEQTPVGWYRFVSPPGLRAMTISNARGKVQAWADGKPLTGSGKFTVPQPSAKPVTVLLRIEQERGCYGGAALPEPIKLDCGPGQFALGDWSKNDGLLSYSGGAWYRKTVTLPAAKRVVLNLGRSRRLRRSACERQAGRHEGFAAVDAGYHEVREAGREPDRGAGLQHAGESLHDSPHAVSRADNLRAARPGADQNDQVSNLWMVEPTGIEPATFSLRTRRSTN